MRFKKFIAYRPVLQYSHIFNHNIYNFHNVKDINKLFSQQNVYGFSKSSELLNKTPFVFSIFVDDKNIDNIVYQELSKINQVLSIYSKNYKFFIYKNLNTEGDHVLFRNWINSQDKIIKVLTILEKVYIKDCNFESCEFKIFKDVEDFDSYKGKEILEIFE